MANEMGTPTFSIVNVPGSSIMREATFCYPTKAGPEVGVASTKAFTAQVTVLSLLALDAARIRAKLDPKLSAEHIQSLARLPHYMEKVLAHADEYVKFGASLKDKRTILFLGRGTMYPIALEGALKLKEITYRHAEGYAAGELKHGPLALVDEGLAAVVLAPTDELLPKTLSNLEEIKSRKGYIIGIGQEGNTEFSSLCNHYVPMPEASWSLNPMLYVVPLQLISYGLAKAFGREIDKPRNLAKSVTVE
jgi:glucosamine--fructose-6-phosphate aminotransferase (isomerizing)